MTLKRRPLSAHPSARTPVYSALRRHWQIASLTKPRSAPPTAEIIDMQRDIRLTRRQVLKAGSLLAAGSALSIGGLSPLPRQESPRIIIVGAGIAGLNAAYTLKKAGINAQVYEAAPRLGGRMYTVKDVLAPGLTTELGGEFIDSGHEDMLALVSEFNLDLLDHTLLEEQGLNEGYFFGGQHYTSAQVIEALLPLLEQIDTDIVRLDEEDDAIEEFDQLSIAQYLDQIGLTSGWLRDLLDVAFVTENGLSLEEQSALNFLWLAPVVEDESSLTMFGPSDERYSVKGGNQQVIDELAARLDGQIITEQRLEAVSEDSGGALNLTFSAPNGSTVDVTADYAILAIPLTTLRRVDLRLDLPPLKRQAINELSYGTNAKLMAGFERRLWAEQGYTGEVFTDEGFQLSWDNSVFQETTQGGITFYSGGQPGVEIGTGSTEDQLTRLMAGFERAFPGVSALHNGNTLLMHWPSYELALGSYSCPTVGQYTTFFGAIPEPVRRLYFAGEHCSDAFWGFMNGGAESGRVAAEALLAAL